ncbi:MAG: hypothetical protein ACLP5H_02570 [Desulfomonilaceae bacterium]
MISTAYTGPELPYEVCSAISGFTRRVDTAVAQLSERPAELAVEGALGSLDETLKEFSDHPNINEVREKAAEFASTRLRIKALEGRSGLPSDEIRKSQAKIKEFRAMFHAMGAP